VDGSAPAALQPFDKRAPDHFGPSRQVLLKPALIVNRLY